ncbi:hypothetical protein [Archangium lansingense]|uniref:Uncharacterized protein n=1 Tax=Archangium lansingense TaxID=2995310 RepID=A0ABT4AL06_9BACT|nr:hypothetical protein [Archangium lansinium]MCY1082355.1 hypothetical protein [Archangium lansinium]
MMRRLNWLLAVLATLSAWPGAANPIVSKSLFARPLGDCKVEVTVKRLRRLSDSDAVVRARTRFAFEDTQCTQEVGELKPANARRAEENYESFTFVDEVCADGTWHYRLQSKSGGRKDDFDFDFDFAPSHTVEVKGCKRKECPARLEAPAQVTQGPSRQPPCKVAIQMGHMRVGDTRDETEPLGQILAGKDVLEVTNKGGRLTVTARAPGKAWVSLPHPAAQGSCAEFTVEPNPYKKPLLRTKKQWAYREFEPGRIAEDVVVQLPKGQRWTLPVSGTARLVPHDSVVRLGVDAQCRPALYALGAGNGPYYTGVMVTDARGGDHLYFVTLEEDPPTVECRVISSVTLMAGTSTRITLPPVRVAGEDLVARFPDMLVRGLRPGTLWLAETPESEDCTRVTVVARPETQQARIAWVSEQLGDKPAGAPMVVQLEAGKKQRLPFDIRSLSGMNDGVADIDLRTSTLQALNPGFTGFLLKDRTEQKKHFIYVEVE